MRRLWMLVLLGLMLTACTVSIQPRQPALDMPTATTIPASTGAVRSITTIKKGLAGGEAWQVEVIGASWSYIWYGARTRFNRNWEHVPMIRRPPYDWPALQGIAKDHLGSYWLIYNEPNYYRQDNLSPRDGAILYKQIRDNITAVDAGARFIVGGVLWLDTAWLGNFRNEYRTLYGTYPPLAGYHVHHYVEPARYEINTWRNDLARVGAWVQNNGGGELWLTEFGCLTSETVASRIMQEQITWLEAQPWLHRYAWYSAYSETFTGDLFSPSALTPLGTLYAGLPAVATPSPLPQPTATRTMTATPSVTPQPTATVTPAPKPVICPVGDVVLRCFVDANSDSLPTAGERPINCRVLFTPVGDLVQWSVWTGDYGLWVGPAAPGEYDLAVLDYLGQPGDIPHYAYPKSVTVNAGRPAIINIPFIGQPSIGSAPGGAAEGRDPCTPPYDYISLRCCDESGENCKPLKCCGEP